MLEGVLGPTMEVFLGKVLLGKRQGRPSGDVELAFREGRVELEGPEVVEGIGGEDVAGVAEGVELGVYEVWWEGRDDEKIFL